MLNACSRWRRLAVAVALTTAVGAGAAPPAFADQDRGSRSFRVEEASIEDIQDAILKRRTTVTEIVDAYLERIKAYNGTCVNEPQGILGPISTIPHAAKLNSLITLNLRPSTRWAWGFDDRKARSQTDAVDNDPRMPDALETAARLDAAFA